HCRRCCARTTGAASSVSTPTAEERGHPRPWALGAPSGRALASRRAVAHTAREPPHPRREPSGQLTVLGPHARLQVDHLRRQVLDPLSESVDLGRKRRDLLLPVTDLSIARPQRDEAPEVSTLGLPQ